MISAGASAVQMAWHGMARAGMLGRLHEEMFLKTKD